MTPPESDAASAFSQDGAQRRLKPSTRRHDENGFGDHGTHAARTRESGDRREQMQQKDGQIAHGMILPRSREPEETLTNLQFAMHRPTTQCLPSLSYAVPARNSLVAVACRRMSQVTITTAQREAGARRII